MAGYYRIEYDTTCALCQRIIYEGELVSRDALTDDVICKQCKQEERDYEDRGYDRDW